VAEETIRPGDAVFVRTGHGSRWYSETKTFYDGAPGIGLESARWFSGLEVCVVGADNFAVEVVPPVDPEVFHPCHQHLIMENGIHLGFRVCLCAAADCRRHWIAWKPDRHLVGPPGR
jgi:kynurenine formamidase